MRDKNGIEVDHIECPTFEEIKDSLIVWLENRQYYRGIEVVDYNDLIFRG